MCKISLKQVFSSGVFSKDIKTNLELSNKVIQKIIEKVINEKLGNSISVEIKINKDSYIFEAKMYSAKHERESIIYLLECRLFELSTGSLINTYLEVFNSEYIKIETDIYDVWSYAVWEDL